jgi:flagellar hook-basal body complex protein FliE
MAIPFAAATNAYASAARLMGQSPRPAVDQVASLGGSGDDFGKMVSQAVQGLVDNGNTADAKAMDLVNGKGDMIDVVTAISQTQLAMETMVTVRDRVISAYEEIMRMPI